jgi:hypothetical protein
MSDQMDFSVSESVPNKTVVGVERSVTWYWANRLDIVLGIASATIAIPAHEIHGYNVAGLSGNDFYGSYTLVGANGQWKHSSNIFHANPTKEQHTEPQFFEWLEQKLSTTLFTTKIYAFIIEINQTNTPCSGKHCRPLILTAIAEGKAGGVSFPVVIARMAAYQIYETQPPKVQLTSFAAKDLRKTPGTLTVVNSCAIHRVPEA